MTILNPIKTQANQIIFWHLIIIAGLAMVLFLLHGMRIGISALLGGLAYWLPGLIFVRRMASLSAVRSCVRFLLSFFIGGAIKVFLSAILFILVVKYCPVNFFYSFIGLIVSIGAYWIASVTVSYRQGTRS